MFPIFQNHVISLDVLWNALTYMFMEIHLINASLFFRWGAKELVMVMALISGGDGDGIMKWW